MTGADLRRMILKRREKEREREELKCSLKRIDIGTVETNYQ